jgi:uncharacterized membrane protein
MELRKRFIPAAGIPVFFHDIVSVYKLGKTGVMNRITVFRRGMLQQEERFSMPFSEIAGTLRRGCFPAGSSAVNRIITIILMLVILIAVSSTIYVIASPRMGERYTEFFILDENKRASDYPDQIITGQNYPMFIGTRNHEYRDVNYTIETWASRTEFDKRTNSTAVITMDSLKRSSFTVSHNETKIIPYTLSLEKTGYNRVEFLLFNESVPSFGVTNSDRINASYRDLHLRVTFREPENQESSR